MCVLLENCCCLLTIRELLLFVENCCCLENCSCLRTVRELLLFAYC